MKLHLSQAAFGALLLALGCGGESTKPPTPANITTTTAPTSTVTTGTSAGVFAVKVTDASAAAMSGVTVNFTATGSGTVSPASATTDAAGHAQTTVTAGSVAGSLTVSAAVSGATLHTDASVTVIAVTGAPCTTPSIGVSTIYPTVSSICITGSAAASDYLLVAFNADTVNTASTSVMGTGLASPPTSDRLAPTAALAYRSSTGVSNDPVPDLDFHRKLQQRTAALSSRFPGARQWLSSRLAARSTSTRSAAASAPSYSAIGANPQVGDILTMNVNGDSACAAPNYKAVRVMAIGTKSIVMADTTNPAGGFTSADYARFAARFDTLVYPLDVGAFGTPTDIDSNGKIGILFTRAVNELTAQSSSSFVGGFFFSRDLFPKATTQQFGTGCAGSNEGEMFYMLAPDPTGIAYKGSTGSPSSTNIRRTGFVDSLTTGTIAHEFQHLINASRRIYVNTTATDYEIVWLNEGLSHIAEELLYYRETGKSPRSNLTDADIRLASSANYAIWKQDAAQNFQRFSSYLGNPTATSPDVENDILATRGATWSFLRYAADRTASTDGTIWSQLVNSTTQGFGTLRLAFGSDIVGLLRDYTLANYLDDTGFSSDPHYQHQSWNFRDIYTKTFIAGVYPLQVTGLTSGASVSVSVARNSAGYYRFTVPAGGEGRVSLAATGSAPSSALQFIVVRTK